METGFFKQIYAIVQRIPKGKVATYGMIAGMAGRPLAARFVGFAMHQAPDGLPCHRVINRKGEMSPQDVFGSAEYQRRLLQSEGVAFLPTGCVDLKRSLWSGEEDKEG